jgi:hypothetical protein
VQRPRFAIATWEKLSGWSRRARVVSALFIVLLVAGGAVRLAGMADAPVHFHSTRQFHCALIARAMFYAWTKPEDDPRRRVAQQASDRRGRLEPPIVQGLAAVGYAAVGREHMAVPRILGIAAWLIGASCLFLLARKLGLGAASLVAAGYFLFVPFGVLASQSFQPDPLMLMWTLAAWLAIVRNDLAPSRTAAALAGACAGLAMLTKPVCVFGIALLYGALALRRARPLVLVRSAEPWLFGVLAVVPSALGYLPELLGRGRMGAQAEQSFRRELLAEPTYWRGWADMLLETAPGPYVIGLALLGLVLAPRGRIRWALWALWLGYFAYGLTFNYHISTHNYYQLPVLPVIALSLAALAKRVSALPFERARPFARAAVAVAALAAAVLAFAEIRAHVFPETHTRPDPDVRGYREIGELVQHSAKVVFVTPNASGGPLEFRAELSGWYWPSTADLRRHKREKRKPFDWKAKLDERLRQGAEYFVSTPSDELKTQRPLGVFLAERYKLVSSSKKYLVYDLRAPL